MENHSVESQLVAAASLRPVCGSSLGETPAVSFPGAVAEGDHGYTDVIVLKVGEEMTDEFAASVTDVQHEHIWVCFLPQPLQRLG